MTTQEKIMYLAEENANLRHRLQMLQSWLRVKREGIWDEYQEFLKSQGSKNDSKTR